MNVYLSLGNAEISVDEAQWCDSEGLLVPWHFPCLFWKECDAGHCDMTDGRRSVMLTHCSMPTLVKKDQPIGEDQPEVEKVAILSDN